VFDTIGEGNDTVTVNGASRHVHGYLRDFLFSDERARSPVKALSGGERNRLLLARLFTRPSNLLVLDEPTNDLDLETLELLEALLVEWPGTLLIVSHDRVFLDNVVTSTWAFEGDGRVREYVGGYDDWLRQRDADAEPSAVSVQPGRSDRVAASQSATAGALARKKLSYNEQRELAQLPDAIARLEAEQQALATAVASPDFYKQPAPDIAASLTRLDALGEKLLETYARWDELDSRS
jgi:ATP-binding cassette subfamily F protein uup